MVELNLPSGLLTFLLLQGSLRVQIRHRFNGVLGMYVAELFSFSFEIVGIIADHM